MKTPAILGPDGMPVRPHFQGASFGRKLFNLKSSTAGPNSTVKTSLSTLRNRVRDFTRNDSWAEKAKTSYRSNLIGSGIRPTPKSPDASFNEAVTDLWNDWTEECDLLDVTNFAGIQTIIASGLFESGEIFIRMLDDPSGDSDLPLKLQVLEADHVDHTMEQNLPNGNKIVQGIEIDAWGRRVAYHVHKQHPNEYYRNDVQRIRIAASEMLHVFVPERPGQLRGTPKLASAISRIYGLNDYEGAELDRKKFAAMLFAFVTSGVDDLDANPLFGSKAGGLDNDDAGAVISNIESGTVTHLMPGEDVNITPPADSGSSYEPFMKMNQRAMAASADVTYEQVTGDYSGVNFSSIRAGLNEMQRLYRQLQNTVIIPQFCRKVYRRFINDAVEAGFLSAENFVMQKSKFYRCGWIAEGWPYVNPVQEATANMIDVRSGFDSRDNIIARKGYDPNSLDKQIVESNKRVDANGLIFDSDPRSMTKSGVTQTSPEQTHQKALSTSDKEN